MNTIINVAAVQPSRQTLHELTTSMERRQYLPVVLSVDWFRLPCLLQVLKVNKGIHDGIMEHEAYVWKQLRRQMEQELDPFRYHIDETAELTRCKYSFPTDSLWEGVYFLDKEVVWMPKEFPSFCHECPYVSIQNRDELLCHCKTFSHGHNTRHMLGGWWTLRGWWNETPYPPVPDHLVDPRYLKNYSTLDDKNKVKALCCFQKRVRAFLRKGFVGETGAKKQMKELYECMQERLPQEPELKRVNRVFQEQCTLQQLTEVCKTVVIRDFQEHGMNGRVCHGAFTGDWNDCIWAMTVLDPKIRRFFQSLLFGELSKDESAALSALILQDEQ